MAILVSNPSTTPLMGLSADPADAALAAPEAGFTEELAVAMRPPAPVSEQGADTSLAAGEPPDDKPLDLQILPPDVLLNAVGDANFALATSAVQPPGATETPAEELTALSAGDPVVAAELVAAALAAQGAQGTQVVPMMQAAASSVESVSASAAPVQSLSGATDVMTAGPTAESLQQEALAALSQQASDLQTELSGAGAPSGVVLSQIAKGAQPTGAVQQGVPSAEDLARQLLTQTSALDQSADQTMAPKATPVALDAQAVARTVSAPEAVAQALTTQGAQVLSDGALQTQVAAADTVAVPVLTPAPSEATAAPLQTMVTVVQASSPTPASPPQSAAAVPAGAVGAASLPQATTAAQNPEQVVQLSAANDLQATLPANAAQMSERMPSDAVQAQAASEGPVQKVPALPTESAFKFDAKLGSTDVPAEPGVAQVSNAGAAPLAPNTVATPRAGRSGIERQETDLEVRDERGTLAVAMQTPTAVTSEKVSASPAKSFDEISSTFVSSLVGGAQRPVTTVMDWVSLQPQARPEAVEPHEVRLDAGAVQVEIQRMVRQGGGQVVMELTPPDQSKFTIELKLDERGGAHLVVEGVSDSTRTRLEQSAPQLHEQFQQMGLNLQLDMRQHRESASSGAQERAANDFNQGASAPEPTVQASRAAAASRAREAGGSQIYLYA
jgi:Flagellar hook-length control protein FliK